MREEKQNSTNRVHIWLPILLATSIVVGMLIGIRLQPVEPKVVLDNPHDLGSAHLGQGKIEELIRYIEAKYVDETDREALIQKAIDNILEQLDPHSNYISAEQLLEINEQLEGNFDGIGIEFMLVEDTIVVVVPLSGGPSEAVGILAGDKIVAIEDSIIAGKNLDTRDVISMLRGEKGSTVDVSIKRGDAKKLKEFTITRDEIPLHSVDASYMLDEETGYIKINRFSATTSDEFMKELETLVEKKGMEHLVIDLRHNPGGYLQQATNILSQLFKAKDKLLVYTEGRAVNRNDYESTGRAFYDLDKIAVLIDEGSASASEIVAGAIQDHDRGVIVGRRSFGKGLVQEQYRLRDGSALRLTVARYFTPSGRSIQKDFENLEAYENDVVERFHSGELSEESAVPVADSTQYYTKSGRVVYGGGGISPDIFIPIDTMEISDHFLLLRQYVPEFVLQFMNKNQAQFDYSFDKFPYQFRVEEALFNDFISFAAAKDATIQDLPLADQALRRKVKLFMKARIAKHLYDNKGFYKVWNMEDDMIEAALNAIKSDAPISSK